jgi:hypothetical protein
MALEQCANLSIPGCMGRYFWGSPRLRWRGLPCSGRANCRVRAAACRLWCRLATARWAQWARSCPQAQHLTAPIKVTYQKLYNQHSIVFPHQTNNLPIGTPLPPRNGDLSSDGARGHKEKVLVSNYDSYYILLFGYWPQTDVVLVLKDGRLCFRYQN